MNKLDKETQAVLEELKQNQCDHNISNGCIRKQKIIDKINKLKNMNFNDYTQQQDGNEVKYEILRELESLLEEE